MEMMVAGFIGLSVGSEKGNCDMWDRGIFSLRFVKNTSRDEHSFVIFVSQAQVSTVVVAACVGTLTRLRREW